MSNTTLKNKSDIALYNYFGSNIELIDTEDLHLKVRALVAAENLSSGEVDTLVGAYNDGLMDSGDTPSKAGRSCLLQQGILCQTSGAGKEYSFSVTYPFGLYVLEALKVRKENYFNPVNVSS